MKDKGINKVNEAENTIGLDSDEYKITSLHALL
jgi:hypothetical protein